MSNNGIPPLNDWQADNYPVIYDEGADELQYVKTGNKTTINTAGSSYLVYTAKLSQPSEFADPVIGIFENTLSGAPTWARTGVGIYSGTLSGAFTTGKTIFPPFSSWYGDNYIFLPISGGSSILGYYCITENSDNNIITLTVLNNSFVGTDLFTLMGASGTILINAQVYQ